MKITATDSKFMRVLLAVDDRLSTRPMFAVTFGWGGLPWSGRAAVAVHVIRALRDHHARRIGWAIRESVSALWLRSFRAGRVSKRGLRPVIGLQGWWQATTPAAVHRCRIALGRLRGGFGRGSVTLFCGHRPVPGELPVYVLVDGRGRVVDMAFDAEDGRLSPGIGRLSASRPTSRSALLALSAHLSGGEADVASIEAFFLGTPVATGP